MKRIRNSTVLYIKFEIEILDIKPAVCIDTYDEKNRKPQQSSTSNLKQKSSTSNLQFIFLQ